MKLKTLLDYSLMSLVPTPSAQRLGLLLLASSHVMNTFQVRPFSNSIEAVLISLSLLFLRKIRSVKMLDKVRFGYSRLLEDLESNLPVELLCPLTSHNLCDWYIHSPNLLDIRGAHRISGRTWNVYTCQNCDQVAAACRPAVIHCSRDMYRIFGGGHPLFSRYP